MCLIVVGLAATARYPLLVAANRDEQHVRPTQSAEWWPEGLLGGRDLLAGGTWLAIDARGRFGAVTNIRDPARVAGLRSRGALVTDFLTADKPAQIYGAEVANEGHAFGAFNLLLYDGLELHFASNRSAAVRLGLGLHSFSNAPPGTAWPKTASALAGARKWFAAEAPIEALFDVLAARDESSPPELRFQRSHFVVGATYGTRCSTIVLVDAQRRVTFAERTFDPAGELVREVVEDFELARSS